MSRPRPAPVSATAGFPSERARRGMPGWRAVLTALVLILAATAAAVVIDTPSGASNSSPAAGRATADARAFLRTYVEPSGRVVRRDQGATTVSEGQAYGLLLAQAAGEPTTFRHIWSWTRAHLLQPSGELSYLTDAAGTVTDATPASDADVLTAWALSRATGPGAAAYHAQARRTAAAVLANETVTQGRRLLLTAGPWATGSPASLDPSYWEPTAFAALARFTGDRRWSTLAASAHDATASLTGGGATLPPDWARLDGVAVSPTPAPNHQAPQVQYGLDAQRLVVWMASSCSPGDRALAAQWWRTLSAPQRSGAVALSPNGTVLDGQTNSLPYVAAAAAAGAGGNGRARARLLARARKAQYRYPTYYGAAWLALGEALLETGELGGCAVQGGSS
ncbi:MAG TPA: glycosyl hydrolase family 8 [Solirubrobacteraceae bacterium]|nr:glycosyl hydrolase family 8 [Solirubrobacteraceae bacterium]